MDRIDAGEALETTATFTDHDDGAPVDPAGVALTLVRPDDTQVLLVYPTDLVRLGTGVYQGRHVLDQAGEWAWEWASTGAGAGNQYGAVFARPGLWGPTDSFDGVTVGEIKARSRVDFAALDAPFDDLDLANLVAVAQASVAEITGRAIDASLLTVAGVAGVGDLVPIARQAVRMRTEQLAYQAQPDNLETSADEAVESFNASGYSETRRGPVRLTRGGGIGGLPAVTGWPALDHLLYLLMTQDQRDFWRYAFGQSPPPYGQAGEVAWGVGGNGYGLEGAMVGLGGAYGSSFSGFGGGFVWGA